MVSFRVAFEPSSLILAFCLYNSFLEKKVLGAIRETLNVQKTLKKLKINESSKVNRNNRKKKKPRMIWHLNKK